MNRIRLCVFAAVFVLIQQPGLAAENYTVPRTQWDQPDLQGVWNFSSEVPMQRPEHFGDREFLTESEKAAQSEPIQLLGRRRPIRSANGVEAFYNDNIWAENRSREAVQRTSLIVFPANGRLPPLQPGVLFQPGGERDVAGQRPVRFAVGGIGRDGPEDRGLSERCLVGFNTGPQFTPGVYNNNVRIIQNRDHVVILTEMVHDARVVRLGDKPELHSDIGLWSGDSRGYWDGDTLVVITKNFNGLTQSFESYGSSKEKTLTERFTRRGPDSMDYQFTIDDPATFTDRITVLLPINRVPAELYEYACHEGNYGMGNMLRASRAREANAEMDRVANLFRD